MIGNNTPVPEGRQIKPGSETSGEQLVRLKYRFMFHAQDGPKGGMSTFVCPASDSQICAGEKLLNHIIDEVPCLHGTLFSLFELYSHRFADDDLEFRIDAYSDDPCILEESSGAYHSLCLHIEVLDRELIEPGDVA